MLKKRVSLVALTLLLVSGIATFGQWRWLIGAYPSVEQTELEQLGYWLALVDLNQQSIDVRRSLVDRFQSELGNGWSPIATGEDGSDSELESYRSQIADNLELLTRDWFYYRCEQYNEVTDENQRLGFVGPQVDMVLLWADIYSQVHNHGKEASEQNAFELFDKLDGWVEQAEVASQPMYRRGIHHSVLYWLSTNQVDELSLETRRELAERIAEALGDGAGDSADALPLTEPHYEHLQANAFALVEVWLLNRALEFSELEAGQQEAYLDRQLVTVQGWKLESILVADPVLESNGSQMQMLKLMGNLVVWADRAPEQHREAYQLLTKSLQQYALKKVLNLQ